MPNSNFMHACGVRRALAWCYSMKLNINSTKTSNHNMHNQDYHFIVTWICASLPRQSERVIIWVLNHFHPFHTLRWPFGELKRWMRYWKHWIFVSFSRNSIWFVKMHLYLMPIVRQQMLQLPEEPLSQVQPVLILLWCYPQLNQPWKKTILLFNLTMIKLHCFL